MRHRYAVLVVRFRQICVAGIAWTLPVCFGPGAIRSPRVQMSLDIDRTRDPLRSTITIQRASPACCQVLFRAGHGFLGLSVPPSGPRKEEGSNPRAFNEIGRDHRAGGVTPVGVGTSPAVKTSNRRPMPRGATAPSVDLRAWAEGSWPQGQLLSDCTPIAGTVWAQAERVFASIRFRARGSSRPPGPHREPPCEGRRCQTSSAAANNAERSRPRELNAAAHNPTTAPGHDALPGPGGSQRPRPQRRN
jgi:hypothetical protein